MSIEFDDQLKAVLARLDELPVKIEANLARGGLRAAAKPMLDAAKARVPELSGTLRDSIKISSAIRKSQGEILVRIVAGSRVSGGGRKGAKGEERGAFYAHMVEFGTKAHTIKGPVKFAGQVFANIKHPGAEGKPFMRPAFDTTDQASVDAYADYMTRNIDKALSKYGDS